LALAQSGPAGSRDAALRQRIAAAADELTNRWPPRPTGSYGVMPVRKGPLGLSTYGLGLSRDVLLLEMANREPSPQFLEAVAKDLSIKVADCRARGAQAGGESAVEFRFQTSRAGKKVEQFRLYFLDLQNYALQKSHWQEQFAASHETRWAAEPLPPGSYLMYLEDEAAKARTNCGWVDVSSETPAKSFDVSQASKSNQCKPVW
jgi:hypothetical protein